MSHCSVGLCFSHSSVASFSNASRSLLPALPFDENDLIDIIPCAHEMSITHQIKVGSDNNISFMINLWNNKSYKSFFVTYVGLATWGKGQPEGRYRVPTRTRGSNSSP